MRTHCYIVLSLLFLYLFAMVAAARIGGWTAIKNLNDPHVKEIADFAVTEHNKQSGNKLKLKSVIKGETQVVSGTNYRLLLTANDGSAVKKYEAVVYEKLWLHYRNLTSFELAH
ncbi:putative Cystatin domain-containing protein [Lupinus albus]|uniref:Putative Cystatin domain-containing protein n=1 Tax=Lupinus albus TaxID=3870 RepID=A0A6A4P7I6_LUPAL|nr:putative Cystatin domain-containing protein [Lupinus albus]